MRRKWFSITVSVMMVVAMFFTARSGEVVMSQEVSETEQEGIVNHDSLVLWYTDEALTDYMTTVALSYQGDTGRKVEPVLVSGVEFLEQINRASVHEGETKETAEGEMVENMHAPDLFVTSHDNLMKAYLSGLASPIMDDDEMVSLRNYPQTALNAVSCMGQYVGYPLFYETNFFLYNKTYMADMAKNRMETEQDATEGEEATKELENAEQPPEAAEEIDAESVSVNEMYDMEIGDDAPMGEEETEVSQEVLEKLSTMIPSTIDDILTFANNYDAPDTVEAVFKWDVSDIFYNYFFVGNYMNIGGDSGDDNTIFNLYNKQAVDCLSVYQNMNQYFSIDAKAVTYDSILQEFLDGKTVFTVATTDAIAKIENAKAEGEFNFDYGVAVLPDISSTLKSRGLSVTNAIVVNGYSDKKESANAFAKYIALKKSDELYKKSGKIACKKNTTYENEEITHIFAEYEKSVPLPKMIEASNFWVQLEIAFTKIWTGSDPDETLKSLSDTIGGQIEEIEYHIPVQESIGAGADNAVK